MARALWDDAGAVTPQCSMPKSPRQKPEPVVFVFSLGTLAMVGRKALPPRFAAIPCYLYRESEAARTKHLDAIPESGVGAADAELVFRAIEIALERADLLAQLCTDAELDAGMSPTYSTGFHPGASLDQACDALTRGGFRVARVDIPLTSPTSD